MSEIAGLVLVLFAAGGALTIAAAPLVWWMRPDRRVRRALQRAVGAKLDGEVIGDDRGAGFSLETDLLGIAWARGRWRMSYSIEELLGVEILVDEAVAARVFRGEPRRPLDRSAGEADSVGLRLLFEDPRHPDFEFGLWPMASPASRPDLSATAAVRQANTWIARIDALLRRPGRAPPIIGGEPRGVRHIGPDDLERPRS